MARKRIGHKYTKIANRIDILSANESGDSRRMPGKNLSMKQLMKEKHKMYWENNFAVHTAPEKYGHLAPVCAMVPQAAGLGLFAHASDSHTPPVPES